MIRREFLKAGGAAFAPSWAGGGVAHLLPTANHRRLILKSSFHEPLADSPRLALDNARPVQGRRSDSDGYFWHFDLDGLEPSRRYTLSLTTSKGKPLCDSWPVRMMPSPQDRPKRLRVAIYTCAGGHEKVLDSAGQGAFLPLAVRRLFFERLLSFEPDAVIAIGDHVYWDQRRPSRGLRSGDNSQQIKLAGEFNRSLPILGTPNESVLKRAVSPQVQSLYGTMFRSTPMFFVQDDHDYFDNDEAGETLVTFPPDAFMLRAGRATRRLYYPEFLPDASRPDGLAGSFEFEPNMNWSECFGTLRYGTLAEFLIYDCRRHLSLNGPTAGFIPDTAEDWLHARTKAKDTRHLVHVPSVPFGWSAGKWGDWYPDILDNAGKLTIAKAKPYWQSGWRMQHDRILKSLAANRERTPLLISGDLHSLGYGRILKSGSVDLSEHAPHVMIAGPISTGATGWPSQARGTVAQTAIGLEMDTRQPVIEWNGFTIADFTEPSTEVRMYGWNRSSGVESIGKLEPLSTHRL